MATEKLKDLFEGVKGVLFVDDSYPCLRVDGIRRLLEASGTARNLQTVKVEATFSSEERRKMRQEAGCEDSSWDEPIDDQTLRGLDELLAQLPDLAPETRKAKARLLWEALIDLESRSGSGVFLGKYTWHYYYYRNTEFDVEVVPANRTGC